MRCVLRTQNAKNALAATYNDKAPPHSQLDLETNAEGKKSEKEGGGKEWGGKGKWTGRNGEGDALVGLGGRLLPGAEADERPSPGCVPLSVTVRDRIHAVKLNSGTVATEGGIKQFSRAQGNTRPAPFS